MKRLFCFFLIVLSVFLFPQPASAVSGVGVGRGKVEVRAAIDGQNVVITERLAVYNSGDSAGSYKMGLTFNERQEQLKPDSSWVEFTPNIFSLTSGEAQIVEVKITIPGHAKGGQYFAYLEASQNIEPGSISAAAAAKFQLEIINNSPPEKQPEAGNSPLPVPDLQQFQIIPLFSPSFK